MVHLFLSKPNWNDDVDIDSDKSIISLLYDLESIIWSVMASEGRSEARLWLCRSISGISSITHQHQCELFVNLLRSKPPNLDLASQLMQMVFERRPQKAGAVLAKKSYILEKFFEGNPRRILEWFSNFSGGGGLEHTKGARALSQFAFVNRDICWEELEWRGKHGQSPAIIATKPHYFLDLDVQRTVENFLENVPEFWSSNDFAESLKDGEILFIDPKFFVDFFLELMYKENSRDVWEVVNNFLMEESFAYLCDHLLITLQELDFCFFLELLQENLNPRMEPKDFDISSNWIEIILSKCTDFKSITQLLLLNAVMNNGRQLLRFVHDSESQEKQGQIKVIVTQICTSSNGNILGPILRKCFKRQTLEEIKLLGLLAWVLHYRLSEECQTPESWESLFMSNGISFRKSNEYMLLHQDIISDESASELDDRALSSKRRKKGKSRKKKRRKFDVGDRYRNKTEAFDTSDDMREWNSRAGSWSLSTDGFSASWTKADLPEHLSKYCLSTWMKWVFTK